MTIVQATDELFKETFRHILFELAALPYEVE